MNLLRLTAPNFSGFDPPRVVWVPVDKIEAVADRFQGRKGAVVHTSNYCWEVLEAAEDVARQIAHADAPPETFPDIHGN